MRGRINASLTWGIPWRTDAKELLTTSGLLTWSLQMFRSRSMNQWVLLAKMKV